MFRNGLMEPLVSDRPWAVAGVGTWRRSNFSTGGRGWAATLGFSTDTFLRFLGWQEETWQSLSLKKTNKQFDNILDLRRQKRFPQCLHELNFGWMLCFYLFLSFDLKASQWTGNGGFMKLKLEMIYIIPPCFTTKTQTKQLAGKGSPGS